MKKYSGLFWVMGLCAFTALMCNGFVWLLSFIKVQWDVLNKISSIAGIIMTVSAVISGWIWIMTSKLPRLLKWILEILFIIFAILAVCGYLSIGL